MSLPEEPTKSTHARDAISRLSFEIDEAWDDHGERIMGRARISRTEVVYENLLFEVAECVQDLIRLLP